MNKPANRLSYLINAMKSEQTRRKFLKLLGTGTIGSIILPFSGQGSTADSVPGHGFPIPLELGLQLYTIRDAMSVDVQGSLKRVAETGYKFLELASYSDRKFYGYEPAEFKKIADDHGLVILGSHTQVENQGKFSDSVRRIAEDHSILDVRYCIEPICPRNLRKTPERYQKLADDLNVAGEIMKEYNIQLGYHNHNFEFARVNGIIPYYDVLLAHLDKDLVTMELDIFWAVKAGQDPVELIKKYPGRFRLFHLKDMYTQQAPFYTTDNVDDFAPVGEGLIDFKRILSAGEAAGLKYLIVEQDYTKDGKPFDAIKKSLTNIATKILV